MDTLLELRDKRAAAWAQAEEFKARHDAGESLSRDDEKAWERALDQVDRFGNQIKHQELDDDLGRLDASPRNFGGADGWDTSTAGGAGRSHSAREPVLLRPKESITGWAHRHGLIRDAHRDLSFDRYLRGLVTGDWTGGQAEQQIYKNALSEGTLGEGGHLVPTPLSTQVIDLARSMTRVIQAGAVTVPMTAQTLKVPRLTTEGTPAWHAENAVITDEDMMFDAVTFTARTLTRLVKLSIELFEDSDPSAADVIARSFARQIAQELDRAALRGSGVAPEPAGVLNQSGVTLTDHGTDGTQISTTTAYDWHLDAAGVVRAQNFAPNVHIHAPRTTTALRKLREATTSAYLAPPADLLPFLDTNQVPTNLTVGVNSDNSEIYTAQWDQLMIGMRTSLQIMSLRERYADNGQFAFLAWLRADVQLAHPAAFVVDRGVRGGA